MVGLVEVDSVARLVAQRPEADAGVVFVVFIQVAGAVQMSVEPVGVVAQRATLAQVVAHTVALDVGLVIDIETVFRGQLIEAVALWVVAEAHGVDVVAPHQFEVASHHLLRHIVARIGIVLMDVHALEFDGLPIDQQAGKRAPVATCALLDLDTSEAHAVGDHLLLLPVLHLHIQSVELGLLRAPWANVWYRGREVGEGSCVLDVDRL